MRKVGTLHEFKVLLVNETCLVLLSPSITHMLGLRGGVFEDEFYESLVTVSTIGMGFNLLTLKLSILFLNCPQTNSKLSRRSIILEYESESLEAFSTFLLINSSIASNLVTYDLRGNFY